MGASSTLYATIQLVRSRNYISEWSDLRYSRNIVETLYGTSLTSNLCLE
jgi:hypothetical protein